MRVSCNWLKQYIDFDLTGTELGEKYTSAGLELDEVISRGEDLHGVVVARVLKCETIEGSDHLHLCLVDAGGKQPLTIVCGAPNVAVGKIVACATVGAVLPGGFVIIARKTFGVLSEGMLCSQKELGLSEEHSGIWLLDEAFPEDNVPVGAEIADVLQLRDEILIIELTPNRSDCLGMINCAREAAALTGGALHLPEIIYKEEGPAADSDIAIEVRDYDLCPRYDARIVKNVQPGPSPLWMQNYLLAAGMRPINNIVDVSNFVMLEMNQPLHTFDLQKIRDRKIVVRAAQPGETMQTLDGRQHEFSGDEILITDGTNGERAICVAGVMGGMETEVTVETRDILIESARFNPVSIRKTSRRLGIPSEASLRFEKGVDTANCDTVARRAAELLVKYCGGIADQGSVDVVAPCYSGGFVEREVMLRPARVNDILGTDFSVEQVKNVMNRLNFTTREQGDGWLVSIPTYRQDIEGEIDLIEEVARLQGFECIPQILPVNAAQGGRTPRQKLLLDLKKNAAAHGLFEAINYSFINPRENDRLLLPPEHPWRRVLPVSNPLSEEQGIMRRSLLPGLLNTASRNLARRNLDLRFFEIGMTFVPAEKNMAEMQPEEILTLALLLGGSEEKDWLGGGGEYSFSRIKGMLDAILCDLGVSQLTYTSTTAPYLHPGRSAALLLNGKQIGLIGEVHPLVAENYELNGRVLVSELELMPLFDYILSRGNKQHDLPKYPASTRDIAVIGPVNIEADRVAAAISAAGGDILCGLHLFDLYDKAPIPEGQRSLAYSLTFRAEDRTLTDSEVDVSFTNIVADLEKLGYKLR